MKHSGDTVYCFRFTCETLQWSIYNYDSQDLKSVVLSRVNIGDPMVKSTSLRAFSVVCMCKFLMKLIFQTPDSKKDKTLTPKTPKVPLSLEEIKAKMQASIDKVSFLKCRFVSFIFRLP